MLSKIQTLHDFIEQSQSMILMNLDMQRNVMLRLSLQLEMGMFSAAMSGLIGMAFGMNLESSLEEVSTDIKTSHVTHSGVRMVQFLKPLIHHCLAFHTVTLCSQQME